MMFKAAIVLIALLLQAPLPPIAAQALEDVRILAADDMEGRAPGTAGSRKAREYILRRYGEIGLTPAFPGGFEQPFAFSGRGRQGTGVNLVGRIDGREAGPVLLILAHYDHDGVRNGQIFNGADDNASGVAGLLAAASALKADPPRHTVIFAAVDVEELGLHGSTFLAENMPGGLERVALVINLDMLSKNDRNELWVAGASHAPFLRPRIEALAARAPLTLRLGHDRPTEDPREDWTRLSDQYPFHRRDLPWLFFSVEDHDEYHTPRDDFETIPREFFARSIATVVEAVKALDADLAAIAAEAAASRSPAIR